MPFQLIRADITKLECDAIVNAANSTLLGGGGVDGAIHRAAGPRLLEECRTLGGCKTGEAKITAAYNLPCKYVIHTVGPIWHGGDNGEKELLESAYDSSLDLAVKYGCESVAFPVISSGAYGYPKADALRIARERIQYFLETHDITVMLVVYDSDTSYISRGLFRDVCDYIDQRTVPVDYYPTAYNSMYMPSAMPAPAAEPRRKGILHGRLKQEKAQPVMDCVGEAQVSESLQAMLNKLDESFQQMLFRLIDEKGMTDAECYKKANVDRKLFSKIRGNVFYRPSKQTALAFAVALELNLEDTQELLKKAGFALSHSNKADIIIEFFISKGRYDIFEINETLFAFDQNLLGA